MNRIDQLIQLCAQSSMQKSAGMSSVARATRAAEIAAAGLAGMAVGAGATHVAHHYN